MRLSCFFTSGRTCACDSEYGDCPREGEDVAGIPAPERDAKVVGVVTTGELVVGESDLPRDRSPIFGTSCSSGVQYYNEVSVLGIVNVDKA